MSINAWGSNDPAEVAKGGTGDATLTDHGVLLGSGTSPVTVTAAPTNGQLLIGSTGADPSIATPTGDTNEIALTLGAGSMAIGIADDPVIPGNASITIPVGTTAQEPAVGDGKIRYDSDTDKLRASVNGSWVDIATGGSSSMTYITSSSGTSVASLEFTNTTLNTYEHFMFVYEINPDTNNDFFKIELSNDNGSSYHSTGYVSTAMSYRTSGALFNGGTTTSLIVDPVLGYSNVTTAGIAPNGQGTFWLMHPLNSSNYTFLRAPCSRAYEYVGVNWGCCATSYYATKEVNNAIRFSFATGNLASINVAVWGIAAS